MSVNRLERLDDAFLFAVGFVGLLITVVQVFVFGEPDVKSLVEILPLLFLGIVMPFYIGYVRGAISMRLINRSVVERMRGWIYMVMGVCGYFGFVLSSGLEGQICRWIVFYSLGGVGLILVLVLRRWFVNVFNVGERISHQYSIVGTITSAYFLPFVLRMLVGLHSDLSARPQFLPFTVFLLTFFSWLTFSALMVCVVYEKVSRNVINTEQSLDAESVESRRRRNFLVRLILLNTDIYRFVLHPETNLEAWVLWTEGLGLALLGSLLFLAFRVPGFPEVLLLASAVLLGLGTVRFGRIREINFSALGRT